LSIRRTILTLAIAGVAAFGVAACGDDDDSDDGGATTEASSGSGYGAGGSDDTAASDASVSFVSPEDGATESGTVTAEVELENFEINAQDVGGPPMDGEGHLHFSMDGGKFDEPKFSGENGKLAKQLGVNGEYSPSTEPTITYENLPAGEHTLEVYLANNDHSDVGVEAETTFTVE
jgi:hypothetical protein